MIYAVGDVHGMLNELKELYLKILNHSKKYDEPHTIVMLGDYIDRGPDSKGVMDYLMSEPLKGFEHICLKGNHEDMMCNALVGHNVDMWISNGGHETIQSFETIPNVPPKNEAFDPYVKWIKNLKFSHRIGDYVFVHAGLNPNKFYEDNHSSDMMWIRGKFLSYKDEYLSNKREPLMVIHGHTPTFFDPDADDPDDPVPVVKHNRINLDTGSVFTKTLTCAVLEEDKLNCFLSTKK